MIRIDVLFMPYLCELFFVFIRIFITINHKISLKQTTCLCTFLRIYQFWMINMNEESEKFSISKSSACGCCLSVAWFFASFSLVLLINVLFIKKHVIVLLTTSCFYQKLPFAYVLQNTLVALITPVLS